MNRRIPTALGRSRLETAKQRVWIRFVGHPPLICVALIIIQMSDAPQLPRSVRTRRSIAEESGGEEILHPRQSSQSEQRPLQHIPTHELDQVPPSDSSAVLSRAEPIQSLTKDTAARKHRSLGVGPPPGQKTKDRRRSQISYHQKKAVVQRVMETPGIRQSALRQITTPRMLPVKKSSLLAWSLLCTSSSATSRMAMSRCSEMRVKISGGQKQRLAIARAPLRDPTVLILGTLNTGISLLF